jgi:hypothetical protein
MTTFFIPNQASQIAQESVMDLIIKLRESKKTMNYILKVYTVRVRQDTSKAVQRNWYIRNQIINVTM